MASPSTPLDLQGKRIAVLAGSVQQTYLLDLLKGFGIQAEFMVVKSPKGGFALVQSGGADVVAANRFFGELQAPKFQLEPTPILFLPAKLYYATPQRRNVDLLGALDVHLDRWGSQPDSPYHAILKRWMQAPPKFSIPNHVWWVLGGLALALSTAIAASVWLRREVARKTRSLQASENKLATILESVEAYIYIKDTALRYQYVNRKVSELFGQPAEAIVGKIDSDFFDADTVTKLDINDRRVIEEGIRVEAEEVNRSVDGAQTRTYLSIKLPLRRDDDSIYALCGISTDITLHKQAEEAIHQLAFFDPLTKLPNRRLLLEHIQQALSSSERSKEHGALLFIDVDNFKDLNDTMGHHIGDLLLQQMAQRLGDCTRTQDTLARQGGDEFVVMLQGLGERADEAVQQARKVAEKVSRHLGEPYSLDGKEFQSSVSIGVAIFFGNEQKQDDLLKQADLAMYRAKADGRNRVSFFDPKMQAQVDERMALEAALRDGLALDQFVLHYPPQLRADGYQVGAEALVRWNHPTRGMVAPGNSARAILFKT